MNLLVDALSRALPAEIFVYVIVFVRVGAAMLGMPGLGEIAIPVRIRLGVALAITVVLTPVVGPAIPKLPESAISMTGIILAESLVGAFIGLAGRFAMSALVVGGAIISQQSGLSAATLFDPGFGQQGAAVSAWLVAIAVAFLFVSNLHHLLLHAVADSYTIFPPGRLPPLGDFANAITLWASHSFTLGVQIAAPFLVFGLIVNLAMGLIARLQPAIQIFFIAQPAQIAIGLAALSLTLVAAMRAFERGFMDKLEPLLSLP
ncbi:MAG: flagellar type III secretion system protein FliR [Rhodospirillales bacterium]|nr:flagellar type III secretion system protein FliR [Rhodospirillales bacterium]